MFFIVARKCKVPHNKMVVFRTGFYPCRFVQITCVRGSPMAFRSVEAFGVPCADVGLDFDGAGMEDLLLNSPSYFAFRRNASLFPSTTSVGDTFVSSFAVENKLNLSNPRHSNIDQVKSTLLAKAPLKVTDWQSQSENPSSLLLRHSASNKCTTNTVHKSTASLRTIRKFVSHSVLSDEEYD